MKEKLVANIKYAVKNVSYHKREFLSFVIAIMVIQIIFGVISFCYFNNNQIDYRYASQGYDYHLELQNLSQEQYYGFINNEKYSNREGDSIYEIVKITERNRNSVNQNRFDITIRLKDNVAANFKRFTARYMNDLALNSDGNYSVIHTPLLDYQNNVSANRWIFVLSLFITGLVALFLMTFLFNTRLNHFKFTYGIYISFGADFKRLFGNSFYEMLVIALAAYIPSSLISLGLSALIYLPSGAPFQVHVLPFVIIFAFSMLICCLSVLVPVKRMTRVPPLQNLSAADNTNLVSSPRISNDRIVRQFPKGYVSNTMIRYRKYLLRLMCSGVLFSMIFMGGDYFADLYRSKLNYNEPRFSLDFTLGDDSYEDSMKESLLEIEGVVDVVKREEASALSVNAHLLVDASDTTLSTHFLTANVGGKRYKATNSLSLSPLDEGLARYLQDTYEVQGDILSALHDEDQIVIADGLYNAKVYKLQPGDRVKIGYFLYAKQKPETIETGKNYLRQQFECNVYEYREYTVAAVIHGMPTGSETPLFLPAIDYTVLAKRSCEYKNADIYLAPALNDAQVKSVEDQLRNFGYRYDNVSVTDNLSSSNLKEREKNYETFILILVYLILLISPVIWMFSQILFYLKREEEIFVLEAVGASSREIKNMYVREGLLLTGGALLLYALVSILIVYVIYRIANFLFIHPGFSFGIPLVPFFSGFIVTGLSAFLSAYIPFIIYRKKKADLIRSVSEERM